MRTEQKTGQAGGTPGTARREPPGRCTALLNLATHGLLLVPVLYIIEISFENYSFFSWHPICMSLGAGLLTAEGVYAVSGEAYATRRLARQSRVRLHWILQLAGLTLLSAGFVVVVANKLAKDKPHFATLHALLGLVCFVLAWALAGLGLLANNARWLYPRLRPLLLKLLHGCGGIVVEALLLATLVNGTFGHWWERAGASPTGRALALAALAVAGLLVLAKPLVGAVARARLLLQAPAPPRAAHVLPRD